MSPDASISVYRVNRVNSHEGSSRNPREIIMSFIKNGVNVVCLCSFICTHPMSSIVHHPLDPHIHQHTHQAGCSDHRRPAGRGRANPPPLPLLTLGPNASKARLILSLLSPSSAPPEIGVAGSEGGRGTCEADSRVGFGDGVGRGRPKAPPKLGAAALDANAARAGVGREAEWVGLAGSKFDFRYDSVRSARSEVSI